MIFPQNLYVCTLKFGWEREVQCVLPWGKTLYFLIIFQTSLSYGSLTPSVKLNFGAEKYI